MMMMMLMTGALTGKPNGKAVLEGWGAFSDGRPVCLRSLAFFNDGYPVSGDDGDGDDDDDDDDDDVILSHSRRS
jgi:hypothetical protein